MRSFAAALFLVSLAGAGARAEHRPAPGDAAPSLSLPSTANKTIRLSDFKGKTVVVAFFPRAFTGG
jgi:hypothetical protein